MQRSVGREIRIRQERRINCLTRRNNRLGEDLSFPSQPVVQSKVRRHLPSILCKQREVFVFDRRFARFRHSTDAGWYAVLQVKKQWSTADGAARTGRRRGHECPVGATDRVWSKATGSCRRRITEKSGDAVENITAGEETAEDLIVKRVQPVAADLDIVVSANDRKIILRLRAPE